MVISGMTATKRLEQEIHKVYPDIKLISTSGPSASGTSFDEAWKWIREKQL